MWKNQGSWNSFHAKLIPNSSIYIGGMSIDCQIWQLARPQAWHEMAQQRVNAQKG